MNKHQRAKIKTTILDQIELLIAESQFPDNAAQTKLRLERLGTTLKRIEANNYGECFKCEKPILYNRLLAFPETTLCIDCLNQPGSPT
jgi:DnaK suppressor protein